MTWLEFRSISSILHLHAFRSRTVVERDCWNRIENAAFDFWLDCLDRAGLPPPHSGGIVETLPESWPDYPAFLLPAVETYRGWSPAFRQWSP